MSQYKVGSVVYPVKGRWAHLCEVCIRWAVPGGTICLGTWAVFSPLVILPTHLSFLHPGLLYALLCVLLCVLLCANESEVCLLVEIT